MAKAIIFDLDGCLVESETLALEVIAEEARRLGARNLELPELAGALLGLHMTKIAEWVGTRAGRPVPDDFPARIDARLMARYPAELRPVTGAQQMLDSLDGQGVPMAVATGSSHARMSAALGVSGLDGFFKGTALSADLVRDGKPAPDLFLLAAQTIGQDPRDCLVLEDSPHGVTGAVAAGMTAVGFVGGDHLSGRRTAQAEALRAAGAAVVIDDLAAFAELCLLAGGTI